MKNRLAVIGLLALIFVGWGMSIPVYSQDDMGAGNDKPTITSVGYYSPNDFYFQDKTGKKVFLSLYPRAVVVKLYSDAGVYYNIFIGFLKDNGLTPGKEIKIEKMEAFLGAAEMKVAVAKESFFVITFAAEIDVISFINQLVVSGKAADAYPIVSYLEELVFPAGLWFEIKPVSADEENNIAGKLMDNGYVYSFGRSNVPGGVPARTYHFQNKQGVKKGLPPINPLKMSRMLSQELAVKWSLPDFVPVKFPLRVTVEDFRPSGTMGDSFFVSFLVSYDKKKVEIDIDRLKNAGEDDIRPGDVLPALYKLEKTVVREEKEKIRLEVFFRVYQPGVFNVSFSDIFYRFIGSKPLLAPYQFKFPAVSIKVVGLVPRDADGKPLLHDIFGWKRMPFSGSASPPKPSLPVYEKTDIRYWVEQVAKRAPGVPYYFKAVGMGLGAIPLLFLLAYAFFGLLPGMRVCQGKWKSRWAFALAIRSALADFWISALDPEKQDALLRACRIELLRILDLGVGVTDKEILSRIRHKEIRSVAEKILARLAEWKHSGSATAEEIKEVNLLFRKLRYRSALSRLFSWLIKPLAVWRRKK